MATTDPPRKVTLMVYDMSKGSMKYLSPVFLWRRIPAIWHTQIWLGDCEYLFSPMGVVRCKKGTMDLKFLEEIPLGETTVSDKELDAHLTELTLIQYTPDGYNFYGPNCNTFSETLAQYLTGTSIPEHMRRLQDDIKGSVFGIVTRPLAASVSGATHAFFGRRGTEKLKRTRLKYSAQYPEQEMKFYD